MAKSTRQQIIEALQARLEAIRQPSDTFDTDAGAVIYVNESPALGEDDPKTAIVMVIGDDVPTRTGEHVILTLPVEIQAIASDDIDNCWMAVEPVLADIKRAIELSDRSLGRLLRQRIERGATRTLPREEGSTTVGVSISYDCPYVEAWGNP